MKSVGQLAGLALAGAAVGWGMSSLTGDSGGEEFGVTGVLILVAALVPAFLLVLALHEAGHLLGGRLAGFRFALFIAGPVKITASGDGLSFSLNRDLALFGGLASSVPVGDYALRRRMGVMVAGGPVASLLLGLGSLAVTTVLGGVAGEVVLVTAIMSLAIALVTSLPVSFGGGFVSDGGRVLMLWRGGERADRWCAIGALGGAAMAGIRPRDWNEEWIQRSLTPDDDGFDAAGARLSAYLHHLDRNELERAGELLESARAAGENSPALLRDQILQESAFFAARFLNDPATARTRLGKSGDRSLSSTTKLRAEAAVLLAEGDPATAQTRAEEALHSLEENYDPRTAKLERDLLNGLLATTL